MTFHEVHKKKSPGEFTFQVDFHAKAGGALVRCAQRPEKTRFIKTGITQKRFSVLYNRAEAEILTEIENEKSTAINTKD